MNEIVVLWFAELVAEIQSQIVLCQEAVAVQDQKLKDTYRNMFQRGESVSQQWQSEMSFLLWNTWSQDSNDVLALFI